MSDARPRRSDPSVILAAAACLAPSFAEWCQEDMDQDHIDCLAKAMRYSGDGYRIARELENSSGVYADEMLVEVLSAASSHIYDAWGDAVAKWVASNEIRPALSISTLVETRNGVGKIVDINSEQGTYCVCVDEHKKGDGYIGTIIPFEDVKPVAAEAQS